jgi:SHS2 domain-containing protein
VPYRYLEDIAIADAAFEAWGNTLEEMIVSAADATVNIMVHDLASIRERQYKHLKITDAQIDMLLFQLLQDLIYYKDADQLLLRLRTVRLQQEETAWAAYAEFAGELIDPQRHELHVDVKAITLHRFEVKQTEKGWTAQVVVDV